MQDALQVMQDVIVPEANDPVAARLQESSPPLIGRVIGVLAAIELYDQAAAVISKICEEGADGGLTSEVRVGKSPQTLP